MKIRIRASIGEEVPVNKDTIIDMNEYTDMLETKHRILAGQIARLNDKIDKNRLELPLPDMQLSFVGADTTLREFDRSIAKFNIDAIKDMIKILFVCHGSILKNPGKADKINGFARRQGIYYTISERALM